MSSVSSACGMLIWMTPATGPSRARGNQHDDGGSLIRCSQPLAGPGQRQDHQWYGGHVHGGSLSGEEVGNERDVEIVAMAQVPCVRAD